MINQAKECQKKNLPEISEMINSLLKNVPETESVLKEISADELREKSKRSSRGVGKKWSLIIKALRLLATQQCCGDEVPTHDESYFVV